MLGQSARRSLLVEQSGRRAGGEPGADRRPGVPSVADSAAAKQRCGRAVGKQAGEPRSTPRSDGRGRGEAYDDLAAIDSAAADALVRIQDPLIERQFVNAYRRGEVDDVQLASALRRYDEFDANKSRQLTG